MCMKENIFYSIFNSSNEVLVNVNCFIAKQILLLYNVCPYIQSVTRKGVGGYDQSNSTQQKERTFLV